MRPMNEMDLPSGLALPLAENEYAMKTFSMLGEEAQHRITHYVQGATSETQIKQRIDNVLRSLTHTQDQE